MRGGGSFTHLLTGYSMDNGAPEERLRGPIDEGWPIEASRLRTGAAIAWHGPVGTPSPQAGQALTASSAPFAWARERSLGMTAGGVAAPVIPVAPNSGPARR